MPTATSPVKHKIHLQWWHRNDMATKDPEFASNGGGAAFGNPRLARQGAAVAQSRATGTDSRVAKSAPATAPTPATSTDAPPKATAAPTKGNSNLFTGLCEALNQHQQELVKKKYYEIADEYAIEFASSAISGAQVVKPGPVTYKNTAAKDTNTAQAKLDSDTDQVNVNSQEWNLLAGTQIVQFIDQVMRSSRYITDQQTGNYDADGKWVPSKTANSNGVTAWYKISVTAKQLGYDKKRRDNAYRMTFIISPYAINQMDSPYFPTSTYRGAHKAFNYWFTGLNTQILSYEQEYNNAYYTTMTGNATGLATPPPTGRDQRKRTYMATSEQRGQGQANYVNEPADNAASFLYSVSDFAQVNMKIVGDPAWMQQGEVSTGVSAQTFDYKPFNPDGTINFDSQEVTFTVSFNRPTDYNFSTGIMNVNAASGAPQETFAYIATSCKNVFSKGQFTQELSGSLLPLGSNPSSSSSTNNRPAAPATAIGARSSPRTAEQIVAEQNAAFEYGTNEGSEQTRLLAEQDAGLFDEAPPTPQPAPPPEPPTSSGDIDFNAGLAGTSSGEAVATPPQEQNRET
jgi:hypothetical protein